VASYVIPKCGQNASHEDNNSDRSSYYVDVFRYNDWIDETIYKNTSVLKEIEEPEGCGFIKCSQEFAIKQCPKTCSYVEPELCKDADCEKPGSLEFCPKTCANRKQNVKGCTVFGQAGDGLKRGSCNESFNCHADGSCKPTLSTNTQPCTVQGSNGDGINRGTCNEGQICFRDGSCKAPGFKQFLNNQKGLNNEVIVT